MAEITISYEGALRCQATHDGSGTTVLTDGPKDYFGRGENFSPSDLLSVSLGGCVLSIMGIAAQEMGITIDGSTAVITKEMTGKPRRIARLQVVLNMKGALAQHQRDALEKAAHACPVHQALGIAVPMEFNWPAQPA